jgi:RNA polymerase sigma-70 factor (ECF subfamily)
LTLDTPDPSDLQDDPLVARARTGDRGAFEDLVRRHLGPARAFCSKLLGDAEMAEDACQVAFLKAWQGLAGFRGEAKFRTWLWRIVVHAARDIRRPREDGIGDRDFEARPERDVAAEDAVGRAMRDLPERQRQVLLMVAELGLGLGEIAASLGISYENAKANLSLARKKVREALDRESGR